MAISARRKGRGAFEKRGEMSAPMTHAAPAAAAPFAYEEVGLPANARTVRLVWAHGWGQDRRALSPLAEALSGQGSHLLLDFPGFGESPPPPDAWDTAAYADATAEVLATRPPAAKTIWVGHSFGCRVGCNSPRVTRKASADCS